MRQWGFFHSIVAFWVYTLRVNIRRNKCPSLPSSSIATEVERSPPSLYWFSGLTQLQSFFHTQSERTFKIGVFYSLILATLWLFPDSWAKFQMLDSSNKDSRSMVSTCFIWFMSPQPWCPSHQHSFGSSNTYEHSPTTSLYSSTILKIKSA